MYYQLLDPQDVRQEFEDMGILTLEQIRIECSIKSMSAVRQAFSGQPVQPKTIIALATRLNRRVREIARQV